MRRYLFTVAGAGDFPFDMLALSECWPASAAEAHKIALACPTVAPLQRIMMTTNSELSGFVREQWHAKKWPVKNVG